MDSQSLRTLGWNPCFERQSSADEADELQVVRVGAHYGSSVV